MIVNVTALEARVASLEQRVREAEQRLHAAEAQLHRRSRAKRPPKEETAGLPWDLTAPTLADFDAMFLTEDDVDRMAWRAPR
jgi:hypothetical protein